MAFFRRLPGSALPFLENEEDGKDSNELLVQWRDISTNNVDDLEHLATFILYIFLFSRVFH